MIQTYLCLNPKCGHEWETFENTRVTCDWCGHDGKLLATREGPNWTKLLKEIKDKLKEV